MKEGQPQHLVNGMFTVLLQVIAWIQGLVGVLMEAAMRTNVMSLLDCMVGSMLCNLQLRSTYLKFCHQPSSVISMSLGLGNLYGKPIDL